MELAMESAVTLIVIDLGQYWDNINDAEMAKRTEGMSLNERRKFYDTCSQLNLCDNCEEFLQ